MKSNAKWFISSSATFFDERFIDESGRKRFITYYQDEVIVKIREIFLEKEQLAKLRSGLIAQLRQRLSYEFPEILKHKMNISDVRILFKATRLLYYELSKELVR